MHDRPNIADRKGKYLSFRKRKSWWAVVIITPKLLRQPSLNDKSLYQILLQMLKTPPVINAALIKSEREDNDSQ